MAKKPAHQNRIEMLQGTLEAMRLEVAEEGNLLRFGGGVKMLLDMNNSPAAQPAARAK